MGYLSQKKKRNNIKELLNVSLAALTVCCFLFLFFKETEFAEKVSPWLFLIYIYALLMGIVAVFHKFFWHVLGLSITIFILFLQIGMGTNLFVDEQTEGLQSIKIFYQANAKSNHDSLKQIQKHKPDVAAVLKNSKESLRLFTQKQKQEALETSSGYFVAGLPYSRFGEALLSQHSFAGFVDLKVGISKIICISLDFSKLSRREIKTSLKNLAEFINMQDAPIIVVGNFGIEAWSPAFLSFLEKTKLEVKNKIILSDGKYLFNPFVVPTINVLAYKDYGIRKMSFLSKKKNPSYPLLIELNY